MNDLNNIKLYRITDNLVYYIVARECSQAYLYYLNLKPIRIKKLQSTSKIEPVSKEDVMYSKLMHIVEKLNKRGELEIPMIVTAS